MNAVNPVLFLQFGREGYEKSFENVVSVTEDNCAVNIFIFRMYDLRSKCHFNRLLFLLFQFLF